MSYDVEELFRFEKTEGGYAIADYLKTNDPSITELELPEEYNGEPVVNIGPSAFEFSKYLKSIKLPKSLRAIGQCAFWFCPELERVEFQSAPEFDFIFGGSPKLPLEMTVMDILGSTDITRPIYTAKPIPGISWYNPVPDVHPDCFIPGVFELLLKNGNFRYCDLRHLLKQMIRDGTPEIFPIAEQYGMMEALETAEALDELLNEAIERKSVELTAYLLELKKRKFGFEGGDRLEL